MHVICVTYPEATSASSGPRGTDMSQSMKKLLCLSLSLAVVLFVCIYPSLPQSPCCNLHPARVQCNCNYFWFSTLTMGIFIWPFPVPIPNSPLHRCPVTELFRVLHPNSISIMRGKVLCCGFSVTNCCSMFLW